MNPKTAIEELENLLKLELNEQTKNRAKEILGKMKFSDFTSEDLTVFEKLILRGGLVTSKDYFSAARAQNGLRKIIEDNPAEIAPASPSGVPVPNLSNALQYIRNFKEVSENLWYDEFYRKIFTRWQSEDSREWTDLDDLKLTYILQKNFGLFRISAETVSHAVRLHAAANAANEPRDWMESLEWDGKPRIRSFFSDYLGAAENPYTDTASANFWVSMAARVFSPGCQMDNMIIFEGAQGIGKSKTLRAIAGKWYAEASESVTTKDFFMILPGKLVIEIAEMDSFSRAEVTRIKQVISCPVDRYRAPYARATQDYPRMSIFVGSTNEKEYLRDNTGARRFWPVECFSARPEAIHPVRKQLFAEAVSLYKSGASWWNMPPELTEEVQEERRNADPWEDMVKEYLIGKTEVTFLEVAKDAIGLNLDCQSPVTQKRLGNALRRAGWIKTTRRPVPSEKPKKMWILPDVPTL